MNKIGDGISGAYFSTFSGSKYLIGINDGMLFLERFNRVHKLRQDTEKIKIQRIEKLEIGSSSIFYLEPLGQGDGTIRITSEVLDIIYFEGELSFNAFKLAMIAHAGQTDLAGVDYLEHIKAVGRNVKEMIYLDWKNINGDKNF